MPSGMWDLSSSIKDPSHTPYIGRRNLNHQPTKEVPFPFFFFFFFFLGVKWSSFIPLPVGFDEEFYNNISQGWGC